MDRESRANSQFCSAARRTSHPASGEDAGPGALSGAKKKAKGGWGGPRRKGTSDVMSEDKTHSSAAEDDDEEEEESNPPPDGGRKKRAASTNLEAEEPKTGKAPLADNSAWDVDSSPERPPPPKQAPGCIVSTEKA